MQGYEEIFIKRGKSYHAAMANFPNARDEEFTSTIKYIENRQNLRVLDLPAGGGYLERYLPTDINYVAYDFSGEFDDQHVGIKKCKEAKIDLEDECIDVVVSLAALHHILERSSFYAEMNRILTSEGQFIIGDVVARTKVDSFLNVFVNQWNSMGHLGNFIIPDRDIEDLKEAGFTTTFEEQSFYWNFEKEEDAMRFFKDLFYLDVNPPDTDLKRALHELEHQQDEKSYRVKWTLGFLVAKKD